MEDLISKKYVLETLEQSIRSCAAIDQSGLELAYEVVQGLEPVYNFYCYAIRELSKHRSKMWEETKKYLTEHISENKPILTDEESIIYMHKTDEIKELGAIIDKLRSYYKAEQRE